MPKVNMDYSNTIIYKIVCKDVSIKECYVGQTTNFTKRKCKHKSTCNNINDKNYNFYVYQFIRENGNWNNWDMIEVEKFNATDKLDAGKKERYWIEQLQANLNKVIPTRTDTEYRIDNKDKIKEQHKEYREQNKDKIKAYYELNKDEILEYHKEYYKQNKEKSPIYYEQNKDKIQDYHKKYYKQNKEQLTQKHSCICGGKYTTEHKLTHTKTKKHIEFVKTI